jgi:hypothetical protein
MPAWREYGAVDLYLTLDCTMWAKRTERSADDLCSYGYGGSDCTVTNCTQTGVVPLLVAP